MKKKLTILDKLQIVLGISAGVAVIPALINETYHWLFRVGHILIALNLILFGVQGLMEKRSGFSYFIFAIASLIIVLAVM